MRLRADRRVERQKEALLRNEFWAKLTNREKLASLDVRLGDGVGAKRQRARLKEE